MKIFYIPVFLVLILICISCGCTDPGSDTQQVSDTPQVPVLPVETRNYTLSELEEFVMNASEYAKEVGMEEAAAEFNDPTCKFVDGTMYIYALYYNGTYIAQPFNQSLVGTNGLSATDTNGMRFIEVCRDIAESGGGMVLYTYPNPSDNMTYEEKLGYVYPVDDEWWIGSGIYLDDLVDKTNATPLYLEYVKEFMTNAASFAGSVPMDEAISEFNNQSGNYYDLDNGMYVLALDYDGNIMAHPAYPEIIGENIYDREMKYGVKSIQRAAEIARNGGGFMIYSYEEIDGTIKQNLNYIMPVEKDDYWIISSGISRDLLKY
ncbi:cache domain-containing protein [Methanolacinia petrolearia]|uniref:cache domain-containing protein n=1 Tax=Methanolacinia petrolearia TaxID=54120 RepID=UPI003BABA6A4